MINRESIDPRDLLTRAQWPTAIYSRKKRCWIDASGQPCAQIMDVADAPRFPMAVAYAITHNNLHALEVTDFVTLDFEMPPSTNSLYVAAAGKKKGSGRQRVKTQEYRSWMDFTTLTMPNQLRMQGLPVNPTQPIIARPFGLTISVNLSHHGDVTNRIKALEDLLVKRKIVDGDQWCNKAEIERVPDLPVECRVTAYHRSYD